MNKYLIRVVIPFHLQTLAKHAGELLLEVESPVTHDAIIDAIELAYPMLSGTIRDHATKSRRPLLRYFACSIDVSHQPPDTVLPAAILAGEEPFIIWGAVAGG